MRAPAFLCSLALAATAAAEKIPAPLVPEYEIALSDAGSLKRLFRDNEWMAEASGSNLYRGAVVRLGPMLHAVGQKGRDSWDGRLGDYVTARLLDKRPARLAYVDAPGLVSPFGVTILDLTPAQRDAASLLVKGLRTGPDVPTPLAAEGGTRTVAVTPIAVKLQKLAAVTTGPCLVVARDPLVAASLSLRCEPTAGARPAALFQVDPSQLFPAGTVVLEKLLGLEGRLQVAFDFDPKTARFVPRSAELPLGKGHLVREGALDEKVLGALPATTSFFVQLFVPDPGTLDVESMESYLRTVKEKPPAGSVPVTLAFLGMRAHRQGRNESLTAVLLPQPPGEAPSGVATLFGQKGRRPAQTSTACPGLLVLSASNVALEAVEEACTGKKPSLRQLPPELLRRLSKGPASGTVYLGLGHFLESALTSGWERLNHSPTKAAPPEVTEALGLLDRLPAYAFAGRAEGDTLRMQASSHSPGKK